MIFYVGECPWELINCLLGILEYDFYEIDDAIYQGVDRPCELIYCILVIEKRLKVT
jgi:hypothetical protein